jgi:UDP-4-amino-4,6-dideoxy-N-acetyl-beta-L-altrosamine N-acetyltransferase
MSLSDVLDRLELRPLHELPRDEQRKILAIRNQAGVRKNMYTSHEIGEAEHFAWIDRLADDEHTRFFAVYSDGALIGGISLNAINRANKRADWAFYLDEAAQGKGLGSALEFKFLDHAFGPEGLEKLNCEVLDFNQAVIRLHKKFGFQEEGIRRRHIERDGECFDAIFLGILKPEWLARRAELERGAFKRR